MLMFEILKDAIAEQGWEGPFQPEPNHDWRDNVAPLNLANVALANHGLMLEVGTLPGDSGYKANDYYWVRVVQLKGNGAKES
jgi:hypothetical protein